MNVIVYVPKFQVDRFWDNEHLTEGIQHWVVNQRPKKLFVGDFVYFVIGCRIEARAQICNIETKSLTSELGRERKEFHLQWKPDTFERFSTNKAVVNKRFHGFRYISNKQITRLQGIKTRQD